METLMMGKQWWKKSMVVGAAVCAGAVCGLSITTATAEETPSLQSADFESAEVTIAEAEDALDTFEAAFPSGVTLPDLERRIEGLAARAGEATVEFEAGFAESEALVIWQCAWQRSLLDAHVEGDSEQRLRALGQLEGFYDLEAAAKYFDDPGRTWYKRVIVPALSGDVEPLRSELKASCGEAGSP